MRPDATSLPGFLPVPRPALAAVALPDLALELYRAVAGATAEAERQLAGARQASERRLRQADRTVAHLAATRHEFERLLARLVPDLAACGREDLTRVLRLFARDWDAELARAEIEVRDPAGQPLGEELAAVVEVEAAVPDPAVRVAVVRDTLRPLVSWAGRVIGTARVTTSVPAPPAPAADLAAPAEEEP